MEGKVDGFQVVNDVKFLYLQTLSEPRDNSIEITVQEATLGAEREMSSFRPTGAHALTSIFDSIPGRPIEFNETCATFNLKWETYVAYLVTEEMAGSCGSYDDEIYVGRLLRLYQKSHFLDHLSRDTGAHTEPLQHYKITCLNHLIDVVSTRPPDIQIIPPRLSVAGQRKT